MTGLWRSAYVPCSFFHHPLVFTGSQELTHWIKQDIAKINKEIASLQAYVRAQQSQSGQGRGKQIEEHNSNVVMMLQSKLASTSISFKDVLEIRTQVCASRAKREPVLMGSTEHERNQRSNRAVYVLDCAVCKSGTIEYVVACRLISQFPYASQIPFSLHNNETPINHGQIQRAKAVLSRMETYSRLISAAPKKAQSRTVETLSCKCKSWSSRCAPHLALVLYSPHLSKDTYIQSRSTAIESIESTISELGQIFTQLATMVAEQRETVQRIDADTVDIASNVSGAQRELLKYYASISSNRWLMLKVFGVLIVFVSCF